MRTLALLLAMIAGIARADIAEMSVAEARDAAQSGEILLIDVRTPGEWAQTGLAEGSVPLDMTRPDFVAALRDLIAANPDKQPAFICWRGVRTARLTRGLERAGFPDIIDVPGGMRAYLAEGLPTVAAP